MPDREKVIAGLTMLADRKNDNACDGLKCCKIAEDALALLKEDCHNCKLECLLQRYDQLKEKYDKLLKEQEEKTGKWIEQDGYDGDVYYDCSACGESWVMIDGTPQENGMLYCPHCGAKMEGR